jgi:protocatechuate 3,4-dioxygenase beta subunit
MSAQLPLLRRIRSAAVVVALAALLGSVLTPTAAMADGTGSISGTAYGAEDATLPDVEVSVFSELADAWIGGSITDENGDYSIPGLDDGSYLVYFYPQSGYEPEYWDNAAAFEDATAIEILDGSAAGDISPTLAETVVPVDNGTLEGFVTDVHGDGIPSVSVVIYSGQDWIDNDYTDSDGGYSISAAPGSYTVLFDTHDSPWLSEWYNDKPTQAAADPVTVESAETNVLDNAELADDPDNQPSTGASLSGKVIGFADAPLAYLHVELWSGGSEPSYISNTSADGDGTYSFSSLDPGSYLLKFEDDGEGDYITEWWQDKESSVDADNIYVDFEEHKSLADAKLDLDIAEGTAPVGGTVYGETLGGDPEPVPFADVELYVAGGGRYTTASTDDQGRFLITNVPAGNYLAKFVTYDDSGLLGEWWDNKPTKENATVITVVGGEAIGNVHAVLSRGASVQGTVTIDGGTPVADARVFATTPRGDYLANTYTAADGSYDLSGLSGGDFKLGFSAPQSLDAWYSDKLSLGTAKILTIDDFGTLTGKDITLKRGASISGNVKGAANANLDNIDINVINEYHDYAGWTTTDSDGNYYVAGLAPGKYTLQFASEYCDDQDDEEVICPSEYRTEYWDNKTSENTAQFITVAASQAVTGRDAVLALETNPVEGSKISGVVTGSLGSLDHMEVMLLDSRGYEYGVRTTDEDGSYEFSDVDPGTYTVYFYGDPYANLAPQYLGNKTTMAAATKFTVKSGQNLTGKNAKLASGARITGTITGGGSGLPNTRAIVHMSTEGYVGSASADENGDYVIAGLAAGSYTVRFTDDDDDDDYGDTGPYADEYWNNKTNLSSATRFTLAGTQVKTGISAELALSATISGTVTPAEGYELEFAGVVAYSPGATYNDAPYADVAADGSYLFEDLAPGTYKLNFETYGSLLSEWYTNKTTQATATPVVVAAGQNLESINATLEPGASITGVVTNPSEELLDDVDVQVWQASGTKYVKTKRVRTDGLGEFTIPGLAPGKYKVSYNDYGTSTSVTGVGGLNYKEEYSDNKRTLASANVITLSGATSVVRNAELAVRSGLKVFTATPKPTLAGIARDGNILTVNAGAWKPAPVALSVQWLRDGDPIVGATSTTYALTSEDVGSRIAASITAIKVGYSTVTKTTAASAVVQTPAIGVITVGGPAFSGTLTAGSTLTATTGEWAPEEIDFSYQWKRAGVAIPNATASTYVVAAADVSKAITVTVTGDKQGYDPKSATSAAKTIGKTITTAPVPTLSGTPTVGQTLTAKPGTWKPAPVTLKYQWLRDGSPITGATKATYKLVAADADADVSVQVTGSKAGYTSVVKVSTDVTIGRAFTLTPAPYISGYVAVGSSVSAEIPTWSPEADFDFVWKLNGVVLPVTGIEISVLPAYEGKSLTVTATSLVWGYTPVSKTSAAYVVGKAFTFTGIPVISGTPTVGQTLTATTEAWAPATVKLAYQWKRNGVSIAGATKASYKLTAADDGKSIFVTVTGSKTGYRPFTETSSSVVATKFTSSPIPTIDGLELSFEQHPGDILTAVPGTWGPATVTLSFQWTRGGTPIEGATSSYYVLAAEDEGQQIKVAVTGSRAGYASLTRVSTTFALFS